MCSPAGLATVYKIVAVADWRHAVAAGEYAGSAHDVRDGFIHFSTAAQVAATAAKHFAGQADLLIVAVDAAALGDSLRWEPSRGGALFPHLYGALRLATVRWSRPLGAVGEHIIPCEVI